ncbi:PD-(D/E)XK nuclease family protein [Candidatus Tisiphia endosymbiont of Dioctria rufipes]|uniref:PD-(D/E)XK nuclease family protein n=1 Tax=Candidatus Tisiphia endosymbiont of Dioctria rufipes TaxID=3066255 RepID=UPI0039772B66
MHGKVQENGIIVYESVIEGSGNGLCHLASVWNVSPIGCYPCENRDLDSRLRGNDIYDETMSFLQKQESKEIDRKGALDILDPCLRRDDIKGSRDDIEGSGNNICDEMMSFLRKQESKEIDRKGALDILDPCFRKDDIKGSRDDIEDWIPNLFLINKITKNTKQNYSVNSPLIVNDHLEYGKIFHKILEDATKINDFSSMNKHPFIHKLPITLQEKIHSNIDKLLNNIEFMALISQELKTEVTIGTTINDEVKIGRIDLLAIDTGKITIIDYKSDASPPKTCQLVKESYIDQLNFYRHIVAKLYPNSEIICKILWLENANFMTIS